MAWVKSHHIAISRTDARNELDLCFELGRCRIVSTFHGVEKKLPRVFLRVELVSSRSIVTIVTIVISNHIFVDMFIKMDKINRDRVWKITP